MLASRVLLSALAVLTVTACSRLQSLPADPPQSPAQFLASQPFVELAFGSRRVTIVQPTSTALVYLLGAVTLAVAVRFLRTRGPHRSRRWWGVGLVLWSAGTFFAGTSYQAFAYEIKCAGRAVCAFTSGWEVAYLVAAAWSIDALAVAHAHACLAGARRRRLERGAAAHAVVYALLVVAGAIMPLRTLVSFELLVVAVAPWVLLFTVSSARRYQRRRAATDRTRLAAWLSLVAVTGAYYVYLALGAATALWARGVWLSENDVLHAGLLAWMLFVAIHVEPSVRDAAAHEVAAWPSSASGSPK